MCEYVAYLLLELLTRVNRTIFKNPSLKVVKSHVKTFVFYLAFPTNMSATRAL